MVRTILSLVITGLFVTGCHGSQESITEESAPLSPLEIAEVLSADDMGGRQTGTDGNKKARDLLRNEFKARGLTVSEHAFSFETRDQTTLEGLNLIARIEGKTDGPVMVVTAHYDHVGTRDEEIYNGADDNASGVAGAFAVADHFLREPSEHDVVIALLDAEEMGLQGARALVRDGLPRGGEMALNVNFDMLSKNDRNELYAAGTYHYPKLKPLLEEVAGQAEVELKFGHDSPDLGVNDWTLQSDHGPFHMSGIPFIYFGVEDHQDYHQPSDTFDRVPQAFFMRSIETVVMAAERLDTGLTELEG